jgi:hypothetical protein
MRLRISENYYKRRKKKRFFSRKKLNTSKNLKKETYKETTSQNNEIYNLFCLNIFTYKEIEGNYLK